MTEAPLSGAALGERDARLPTPASRPRLSQAQYQTAEVVANLAWDKALVGSRPHLGLPARFTLRAAGPAGLEGARAVHVAAAAELTERALQWHRSAAFGEEPLGLAILAGDYCLAQAAEALSRYSNVEVEAAFADGLAAAGFELARSGNAERAARQILPACGLAGASAARLPASRQARWWRLGRRLAGEAREVTVSVEGSLSQLLWAEDPVERQLGQVLAADPALVATPMASMQSAGGKRIRARLVLLTAELGPHYRPDAALRAAAAMELLHAATLCHDDLVDGAASRRGAPTVATLAGPLAALGVGDHYLGRSAGIVARLGDPKISRSVSDALVEIANGQLRELDRRSVWSGELAPYVQVAQGKTGALLAACAATGSRLSGAPRDQREAVIRFARKLGLAFQGIDDCLDFSDPERTGKPAGTDLTQGICGLPVLCALRGPQRKAVRDKLTQLSSVDHSGTLLLRDEVVALVRESGALATARSLADRWSMEAVACLGPLAAQPRARLERFADQLTLRDS
ncbi:MAG TPA: polyprenyl synthetase family protein [Candidatus Nanopelagicaceae bacterium]|nr:polyprenyl synthetase family protein [Candidatus Nanopelagicaceae bacterium]